MSNAKSEPEVNSGLWVIMACQCRFITCNKCTLWCRMLILQDADIAGGSACVSIWELLYFLLNFAVNLKLLLEIKSI